MHWRGIEVPRQPAGQETPSLKGAQQFASNLSTQTPINLTPKNFASNHYGSSKSLFKKSHHPKKYRKQ
jgi:hypothetical protein